MAQWTPKRPLTRVVGVYAIPYCPELYAVELIIPAPPHHVDFAELHPFQPPAWDPHWEVGVAHFYLNGDGTELIGSYLGRPPLVNEDEKVWSPEYRRRLLEESTRAVLLMEDYEYRVRTSWGSFRIPARLSALPERLLRLIWIEEGLPSQSGDQAYLEDL